jgi:hypothetical protein
LFLKNYTFIFSDGKLLSEGLDGDWFKAQHLTPRDPSPAASPPIRTSNLVEEAPSAGPTPTKRPFLKRGARCPKFQQPPRGGEVGQVQPIHNPEKRPSLDVNKKDQRLRTSFFQKVNNSLTNQTLRKAEINEAH